MKILPVENIEYAELSTLASIPGTEMPAPVARNSNAICPVLPGALSGWTTEPVASANASTDRSLPADVTNFHPDRRRSL